MARSSDRTLVTKFAGKVDPSLEQAQKRTLAIGTGLGTMFGSLAAKGIGAAIDGVKDFAREMIGAASDAEQAAGGVEAVFKKQADAIVAQSERAAKGLGLSKTSYQELATVLGAGLKNKGIQDFAGQTQKLIDLGADLAAQYGGSTQDAVAAVSSLMRGEADPIERYGVAINETAISAELAARGQSKLTGAALETAKAQARLDILFRQTKDAQGAFARESETLAGKQQRAAAQWDDLKAKVGEAFLPTLTGAMGFISDTAIPGLERFGDGVAGIIDIFTKGDFTGVLADAFGWQEDMPIVGVLFSVRDAVVTVWDKFKEAGPGIVDALKPAGDMMYDGPFAEGLTWLADVGIPAASGAVVEFLDNAKGVVEWVRDNEEWLTPLGAGVAVLVGGFKLFSIWQGIVIGGGLAKWLLTAMTSTKLFTAAQWLANAAMSANPIGLVVLALAALGTAFAVAWNKSETFRKVVLGAWEGIKTGVAAIAKWFEGVLNGLFSGIEKAAGFFGIKLSLPRVSFVGTPPTTANAPTGRNNQRAYAAGGYTGPGGKWEPAGVVHRGEVVWSQDDVAAHGGPQAVDALRRSRFGFAAGGIVPNARQGFRGYDPAALAAMKAWAAATGRMWTMTGNGGARSFADQKRAWDLYRAGRGPLAANPYRGGPHMMPAVAIDLSPRPGEIPSARALLGRFGLGLTVRGEPWHVGYLGGRRGGQTNDQGGGWFDPLGWIKQMLGGFTPSTGGGGFGEMLNAIPSMLVKGAADWLKGKLFDSGGWLEPGATLAVNKTGQRERVLTNPQWHALSGAADTGTRVDELVDELQALTAALWVLARGTMTRADFEQLLREVRRPGLTPVEVL